MWELPDFGSYPIEHLVTHAEPINNGVEVTWDDGLVTRYHRLVLREHSPDAQTTNPLSREQQLQLTDIDEHLTIVAADADVQGGLTVSWSHGSPTTSSYHPGWLRAWAPEVDEQLLPDRVTWDASLDIAAVTYGADVFDRGPSFEAFSSSLYSHGIALVRGLPIDVSIAVKLPAMIGPVRATNFGETFDVQTKAVEVTSNAYTDLELPVHVDLATREYMPGLQFLFCMVNDAQGGESRLSDGATIARVLRDEHSAAFDALTTIEVIFANKAADSDYRHRGPLLVVDAEGDLIEARWSPWLRAPLQASIDDAERFYRALRLAMSLADDSRFTIRHRLEAGDMLAFDNRRLLHGRASIDRTTGGRWLRGSYVEREELASCLRVLQRS